ncbi:MAG: pilus assembly protein CpaD [Hyphomicrobiaceae bacterium]|jgi:pilus assembly protein CpaD
MTYLVEKPALRSSGLSRSAFRIAMVAMAASAVVACRPGHTGPQVAGWSLIEPTERHPILVSQRPVTLSLPVRRGSYGLSNSSRHRVARFLGKFRTIDTGNSKLVISAPTGRANEVAAMQAVAEVREMISDAGFSPTIVHVETAPGSSNVRLSYLSVVAKGPECGHFPTNLGRAPKNASSPNFGCTTQKNFAAMIANPADLLGPRTMTPRMADRRDHTYGGYVKGESTTAKKSKDEKASTQKTE